MRAAWDDIEHFKEQKDKDLREALISYAIMQISMCKKVWAFILVYFVYLYKFLACGLLFSSTTP